MPKKSSGTVNFIFVVALNLDTILVHIVQNWDNDDGRAINILQKQHMYYY